MSLNPNLVEALNVVFGEVKVTNESCPGRYTLPPRKSVCFNARLQKEYASVLDWGEVYHVCCPVCRDSRFRLYFSHLYGKVVRSKTRKANVYFGHRLAFCQNEKCHLKPEFEEYKKKLLEVYESKVSLETEEDLVLPVSSTFNNFVMNTVELPAPNHPLVSDKVSAKCISYIQERGFDPQVLDTKYMCRYVPENSTWKYPAEMQKEDFVLFEEGLLIPIIMGRDLVGWQVRKLYETKHQKYINTPTTPATRGPSKCLYNIDKALLCKNVVICEGVTDVWRIEEACEQFEFTGAIALFGKHMSVIQMEMMKTLWGYDGCAILALDPDASEDAQKAIDYLKLYKVFPRGVFQLSLPAERKDPAKCIAEELKHCLMNCGAELIER